MENERAQVIERGGFLLRRDESGLELFFQGRSLLGPLQLVFDVRDESGRAIVLRPTEATRLGAPALDAEAGTLGLRFFAQDLPGLCISAQLRLDPRGLVLTQSVENRSGSTLRLIAARLVARPGEGTWLDGVGASAAWRLFGLGFNTFSPAQSHDSRLDPERPRFESAAAFCLHTQSPYYGQAGARSMQWLGAFTRRGAGGAVTGVLGFLSAESGLGEVVLVRGQPPTIEARLGVDGKRLPAGETWTGDALRVTAGGDGPQLLAEWAKEAGRRMRALPLPAQLPTGWCSWYRYYGGVTEKDVRRNVAALRELRERLPVRYVQLDDGYQKKVGDWLALNRKFPSGLRGLADAIREAGFVPGIWTAPFFVQRGARLFREHPEWLLHDPDGELRPLGYHPFWGITDGQVYALDTTHPGAQGYLRHVFGELCAAGFDYFKIDFLFAGLRLGRRYDERLSPVEAYREGLRVIRETIDQAPGAAREGGGGRYLLGCGAPLLPSVGLVDGMRISPDVKEVWRDPKIAWLTRGASHPAVEQMLPSCMTRAFLHGALWANDPDCLLVRAEASRLTLPEVQTLLTVLSLTGGLLVLSDDVEALPPDRRALAELALPPLGEPAVAVDLLIEERPERFIRRHAGTRGPEVLVALINWHDAPTERLLAPAEVGLVRGLAYHAFELWTERYERIEPGRAAHALIPAHGNALWLLRPAGTEPAVVSVTHHLGQTTTLLREEWWDAGRKILRLRLRAEALRQGRVLIAVPPELRAIDARAQGAATVTAIKDRDRGVEQDGATGSSALLAIHVTLQQKGSTGSRDAAAAEGLVEVLFAGR